jgi:hypothetical protein
MKKTHLKNTKDDEKWWGYNKRTRMPIRNSKIATSNSEGHQKDPIFFLLEQQGAPKRTSRISKMMGVPGRSPRDIRGARKINVFNR